MATNSHHLLAASDSTHLWLGVCQGQKSVLAGLMSLFYEAKVKVCTDLILTSGAQGTRISLIVVCGNFLVGC